MSALRLACFALLAAAMLTATACVERTMLIRSDPSGAPVWVDEQHVGATPVEHEFVHYGWRRVRVGPIRDAQDKVRYREQQRVVQVEAPWYEAFPLDFFFEVIYPFRLTDAHEIATFELPPGRPGDQQYTEQDTEQLLERAEQFRREALTPVPETD
ncbi:MAG: PEGA domain-containing protein [Candidatus Brocadiia bacterium]